MRIVKGHQIESTKDFQTIRIVPREIYDGKKHALELKEEALRSLAIRRQIAQAKFEKIRKETAQKTRIELMDAQAQMGIECFFALEKYIACAKKDIRTIAVAIVQKILGVPMQMDQEGQKNILEKHLVSFSQVNAMLVKCCLGRQQYVEKIIRESDKNLSITVEEDSKISDGLLRIKLSYADLLCRESVLLSFFDKKTYEQ